MVKVWILILLCLFAGILLRLGWWQVVSLKLLVLFLLIVTTVCEGIKLILLKFLNLQ
jgi:hypothetical protein